MIIGVISDTHDALPVLDTAFQAFVDRHVGLVVHCGDWKSPATVDRFTQLSVQHDLPWKGVLGNNDREVDAFKRRGVCEGVLSFMQDNQKIAAYHGHHKPTLNRLLRNEEDYDVLLRGHSHKPRIEMLDGLAIINPGSTAFAIPRSKSWKPTIALYNTDSRQAEVIYLF